MKATMYLHSDKERNATLGEELGLTGEALHMFLYALCEVKFEVEIDEKTGDCIILTVDGMTIE